MKNLSPIKSIRKYCLGCMNGFQKEVLLCNDTDCPLHSYRLGKGRISVKTLRRRCLDCGEGTVSAVRNCDFPDCPLYPYRLGKNPNRRGIKHSGSFGAKNISLLCKILPSHERIYEYEVVRKAHIRKEVRI